MRTVSLQQICDIQIGKTPSRSVPEYWGGDLPWVTISDFAAGRIVTTTKERITRIGAAKSGSKRIPRGTLLLSFKLSLGKRTFSGCDLFTNEAIAALQVLDRDVADRDYLYWALGSIDYDRLVDRAAKGKTLNKAKLKILQIPLPPLAEQKRIAGILDAADALRAKRREALAQLDTLIQSTFLDMFGDPVSNPMGWEEHEVEKVCRLVRGSSPRPKGDPRFYDGPVPRLMVSDITRDGFWVTPRIDSLTEAGAKKSRRVPAGTVVMAVSGEVGVVATVQDPCCVHDGFVAFLDLDESVFDSRFFMFQFHSLKITHERRKAGAIFQNLTTRDIKAMRLPTPTIDLQHRFAAVVESVERQKADQRTHLAELDTLFASLQSRAFRGDI